MPGDASRSALLRFAHEPLDETDAIALRLIKGPLAVTTKPYQTPVTRVDTEIETHLRDRIGVAHPGHAVDVPVACAPQAWAAGAVFMLLQACIGLEVDALASTVHISNSRLPLFLDHLQLENVAVGDARLDLRLQRQRDGSASTSSSAAGRSRSST